VSFLRHYHQRSNSESSFSAIKRLFGEILRIENDLSSRVHAFMLSEIVRNPRDCARRD
jgi:transposase